jgi:CBS-domain-containing membrane protein
MTRSVVTVLPRLSVQSAMRLMHDGRFRHVPVLEDDRLVGILSDRDVRGREHLSIAEVMQREVITVNPSTPVEVAARLLLDNKIGALPVVDEASGALVGIVSQTDLFGVLAQLLGGDDPSTRLELQLEDLPGQLALVARLAHDRQVPITSLVTLPATSDTPGRRCVVLRIGTILARPFIDELRQAGIAVDSPSASDA